VLQQIRSRLLGAARGDYFDYEMISTWSEVVAQVDSSIWQILIDAGAGERSLARLIGQIREKYECRLAGNASGDERLPRCA
jgi:hypothetical protein